MKIGIKNMIATIAVLGNLTSFAYAKNYEKGLSTKIEKQHKIDLIGDFSREEEKEISRLIKKINKKIDRKKAGIEVITMEKAEDLKNYDKKDVLASANVEENTVLINRKKIKEYKIRDYSAIIAHEIGHLAYEKQEKEYFNKWIDFIILADTEKRNYVLDLPGCSLPNGYVSDYPLSPECDGDLIIEDFAETFSYWINDQNYANNDKIVKSKINTIKQFLGKK